MMKKLTFFFFPLYLFCALTAFSQNSTSHANPKIGLVLSGGGAKGMAHVGVIKAMEKAGIRPDYIAGTSMGAVIGGLYAIGYNADELESIIKQADWSLIVSNRVNFNNISFEEKEYYNRYMLELPVIDRKISVPTGLIEGQKLSETLHYYTWPAIQYKNFDEFPIPFRCIATDLRSGQGLVLKSGYLPDALRSSIAIPTAFTPFDLDSTLVVDGGVVNNFPVDVVKDMGADIVIGVNVSDEDFIDPKELSSFSGILMQIAMSTSTSKLQDNIANCDIYIKPDLKNYSTASFSSFNEILELGDKAGEENLANFLFLADSLNIHRESPGIGLEVAPVIISEIAISGNRLFSDDLILSKLGIAPQDTVSRSDIQSGIDRIFGVNGFRKVDYNLLQNPSGDYKLFIKTAEKQDATLSSAFHYDDTFSAGILLNLTVRDLLGKPSRTVAIADISENPKFRLDHYKYIGKDKKYAFNFRYNFLFQQIPEYENGEKTDITSNRENQVGFNVISTHSLKQSFSVGAFYESTRTKSRFNVEFPEDVRGGYFNFLSFRFIHNRNSLNDRNYPTRGAETIVESIFYSFNKYKIKLKNGVDTLVFNGDEEPIKIPSNLLDQTVDLFTPNGYVSVYLNYVKYFPISHKFQVAPTFAAGITLSEQEEGFIFNEFSIGGYQRVQFNDTPSWGLNYRELSTPNFAKLGILGQFVPTNNIYMRFGGNIVAHNPHVPINQINKLDFSNITEERFIFGYGMDVSYDSFLGPITGGIGSNAKDGTLRYYLSIGFSFNYSDR
ncbi:patatin-like phospholipase family protein [Echinicola arenosa]|nr:patatin-like phospholipase family protein [Echinicola arenosa]